MLGAYGSAVALVAASLVVGQAVLALAGRRAFSMLAGPVGLAALLVVGGAAIRLPGDAGTVAVALAAVAGVAALVVARLGAAGTGAAVAVALPAGLVALAAASIPFAAAGRAGILGVGLVNDDMASHLLLGAWLAEGFDPEPVLVGQGYPLGPHALAAGLDAGLGAGLVEAFAGLTLAIPALTAMVAAAALAGARPAPRAAVGALVALPYLAAAYLAQEAFKEPMIALLLLGFALCLPSVRAPRDAIPLGMIAAGAVYVYSFPGLAWLAATAALWLAIGRLRRGRGEPAGAGGRSRGRGHRGPLAAAAVALAVLAVLTVPDWGRVTDFTGFRALDPDQANEGGLGNLRHQLSPLEALGVWPTSEFRLSAADSSLPAAVFYGGGLLGVAALVAGLPGWVRRHGPAVPAAIVAALAVYLGARAFGTVYTSAKALAVVAPLVMLVALGGPAGAGRAPPGARRRSPALALAILFALAAGLSSFLVLRQAPVGPEGHLRQLESLRPLVAGRDVLFLGRDNFVLYGLRGSRPFVATRNFYDPYFVRPSLRLEAVFEKFDFDSVPVARLARFPYVVTSRAAFASAPPPGYEPLRLAGDYVLWRRGPAPGGRHTLAEGPAPGAVLRCDPARGERLARAPGVAAVVEPRPVSGARWAPAATIENGAAATQSLRVPAGRWEVSLQYDSTRPLDVTAPGLDATLPANLDYRGPSPYWPAGELAVRGAGVVEVTVRVDEPPALGRLIGADSVAHLRGLALTPARRGPTLPGEAARTIPLADACGRYVDWYRIRG